MNGDIDTSSHFRSANREFARSLLEIIGDLREYWPLTVRQVYYQAVARLLVSNNLSEYQRTSKVLTKLRRGGLLRWDAIEDRTRRTVDKRGISDVRAFAAEQMETFMDWRYYHRCFVQDQEFYVEVATEKDALSSILEKAIWIYCTRLNVVRGQVSATMVKAMADRFTAATRQGQTPILLYLGDLDPSGVAIPKALERNLWEHHGVDVEVNRIGLNPDQVERYGLPQSLDAAKKTDPNYQSWLDEYGDQAPTELDALHPGDIERVTVAALQCTYDVGDMLMQERIEAKERELIQGVRLRVEDVLYTEFPSIFGARPDR